MISPPPPPFKLLFSNERLEFCDFFFFIKDQKEQN